METKEKTYSKSDLEKAIKKVVFMWEKIPNNVKNRAAEDRYAYRTDEGNPEDNDGPKLAALPDDDQLVVWIIDRQKPSVEPSWDFDRERFGVTRTGKIVWGFDSGCSCPSPFENNDYQVAKEFKSFVVHLDDFDVDMIKEACGYIESIIADIKKG